MPTTIFMPALCALHAKSGFTETLVCVQYMCMCDYVCICLSFMSIARLSTCRFLNLIDMELIARNLHTHTPCRRANLCRPFFKHLKTHNFAYVMQINCLLLLLLPQHFAIMYVLDILLLSIWLLKFPFLMYFCMI